MTNEEEREYDRLTAEAEQIHLKIEELTNKPVTYGYIRVSSKGQAKDGKATQRKYRNGQLLDNATNTLYIMLV